MTSGLKYRPKISMSADKIFHDGDLCRVVIRRDKISVGCTDITPEALEWLLRKYQMNFGKQEEIIVVQEGA